MKSSNLWRTTARYRYYLCWLHERDARLLCRSIQVCKAGIPTTFDFEDYSPDEIVEIILLGLRKQGYQVNGEALYGEIVKGNYMCANDHSNGRWVRNLNEKLLRQVSTRVTREGSTDCSILDQDLVERE